MPMRLPLLALAVCVVAGFAAIGCSDRDSSTGADADSIRIGHYGSLTGSEATFGQSTDAGIQLAIEEVNAAGGIKGKKIELITYDDKGDVREVGTAVTRLVTRDNVVAVIGEVASGLSLAGAPVCQEHGVPMITPSSTNPRVTKVGDRIFRVCFIDPFQGYVCAKFARQSHELKAEKVAMLVDQSSPYSVGLADEFRKAFESMGGTMTSRESYNAGDQDFSAQLTSIRGGDPDVLFIPGYYTDVANIAIQARKLGIKIPLLGGDGWDSPKLAEIAGDAVEGCYYSNHYSHEDPNPVVQEFITKYQARFGNVPDGLAALGYDAAMLLFDAMRRGGSDGETLARSIATTKDFEGVTGRISIDAERNAIKPAVMLKMKAGVPTFVTTIEPGE